MNDEKRYRESLDWIHGLSRFGTRPGLERITALLKKLGNPHRRVNFVHIAGTNGKGSTAAILASIMRAAGYRTGLYTSPYLLSFSNRMAVNGDDISPGELADLVDEIRPLVEQISADNRFGHPTEFEVVTVLALIYFARKEVDLVVLEVGLGGRLDATNVVIPLLSVITNVSLEHTDVLGDTVGQVAKEKAGIIKKGVPVLTAAENHEVLEAIRHRAEEMVSDTYYVTPEQHDKSGANPCQMKKKGAIFKRVAINDYGQSFYYRGLNRELNNLFIPLRGDYQVTNAATAIAAAELIDGDNFKINEKAIREGLSAVYWPGRMELLQEKPKLVMDGAHNPAAIKCLANALPEYFDYRKVILVFGIMADKDKIAMMGNILPLADKIIFTRASIPRAADPYILEEVAINELQFNRDRIEVVEDYSKALEKAFNLAGIDDLVLVSGSFYTVSDIRAYWEEHLKIKSCE